MYLLKFFSEMNLFPDNSSYSLQFSSDRVET